MSSILSWTENPFIFFFASHEGFAEEDEEEHHEVEVESLIQPLKGLVTKCSVGATQ